MDADRDARRLRIVVNFDLCDSNGLCTEAAPELFELDEEDVLRIRTERPDPRHWQAAEDAVRACPKLAISLVDAD